MQKLNKITIQGFRRLRDVAIDMRPFMVMIGGNGVGKTSLLDALSLFSASAAGRLNLTLNDMGGALTFAPVALRRASTSARKWTAPAMPLWSTRCIWKRGDIPMVSTGKV